MTIDIQEKTQMKKITRTTIKSFIRRHRDHLHVMALTYRNRDDMHCYVKEPKFVPADTDLTIEDVCGIGSVTPSLEAYSRDGYEGYEVSQSYSGTFVLAVRSEVVLAEKLDAKLPRAPAAPSRTRM